MAATDHTQTPQRVGGNRFSQYATQEVILFLIAVLAILILASQSSQFLTLDNLLNQGRLLAEIGLVALPMTYIIITGGIDLSVGSAFGLSAVIMGYIWQELGVPLVPAIGIGLLVGVLCGLLNGLFITRIGVPPLITTLATLALYRGVALGISQGRTARDFPEWFLQLGQGTFLDVPTQLWILFIALIISAVILSQTPFGRSLYAIGNNELGARFSGIPVDRIKLLIYAFSGFMAGLAGLIFTARVSGTRSDMGTGLELDVITAVVLGGTSIFGGSGSMVGTLIGFVLIQLLKNGLSFAGFKSDSTIVITGFVLILAILLNNFIQRSSGGR
jgi:rhamnose transport system permease protein